MPTKIYNIGGGGSSTFVSGTTFGDGEQTSDALPSLVSVQGQSAYSHATGANQVGGNLELSGGIGTRQFTIVSNAALATKTVTLTANGTLVTLTASAGAPGLNEFGPIGVNDTAPELAVTAAALAAAITAHATLSTYMSATSTAAVVYIDKKYPLYSLVIASGTAGALVTATSGTDGAIAISGSQILAPDGTAAAPALAFVANPNVGFYNFFGNFGFSFASGQTQYLLAGGYLGMVRDNTINWATSTTNATGSVDLTIRRRAAATLNLGAADAASPVAQTLSMQGTSSNDTAGAKFILQGSLGKGTGSGGDIAIKTGVTAGAGATANTASTRTYQIASPKTLVSGAAATDIFEIALPTDNTSVGYTVHYVISFADGTNAAIHEGICHGAAYRATGGAVTTANPVEVAETNVVTGGTNTTDTWTATAGAGKITILLTATKGNAVGAATLSECSYSVRLSGKHSTVTPL